MKIYVDAENIVKISISAKMLTVKTIPTNQLFSTMKPLHDFKLLSNSSTKDSPCANAEGEELPIWIRDGGFILVFLGMISLFWGLAEVCDHYFVASLLVFCEEKKIPDNVI